MTKAKKPPVFNEHEAVEGYSDAHRIAVEVFGESFVKAQPMVIFRIQDELDGMTEPEEHATLQNDLAIARDLVKHFEDFKTITANVSPTTRERLADAVFGVYDRVLDPEFSNGEPEHLEAAARVAEDVLGSPAAPIEAIFAVYDRAFGSPYEE